MRKSNWMLGICAIVFCFIALCPFQAAAQNFPPSAGYHASGTYLDSGPDQNAIVVRNSTGDFAFTGSDFTVECWFRWVNIGNWSPVIAHRGEGGEGWQLRRQGGNNVFTHTVRGAGNEDPMGATNVNDGQWHHAAGVYAGVSEGMSYLYIDGRLDYAVTRNAAHVGGNDHLTFFARDNDGSGTLPPPLQNWVDAEMDEVRIWSRALTQTEVQANMYSPLTGAETGLAGYWNFDEGTGAVVNDSSPGAHHGDFNPAAATFTWELTGPPPISGSTRLYIIAGQDAPIACPGFDPDRDPLTATIATIPSSGTLYQSAAGARGAQLTTDSTVVTDPDSHVIFDPGALVAGNVASFTYFVSDGTDVSKTVTVELEVLAGKNADVAPAMLNFGGQLVDAGPTVSQTVAVTAAGGGLVINQVFLDGVDAAQFTINAGGGGATLLAGQTLNIDIVYNPTDARAHQAGLVLVTDDPVPGDVIIVPLRGVGNQNPIIIRQGGGINNWAIHLDGNSRLEVPFGVPLNGQSFTWCFWEDRQATGESYILGQMTANANSQHMHHGYRDTGVFTNTYYNDDLNHTAQVPPVSDGWHHWALTYDDRSGVDNWVELYLDGVLVDERNRVQELNVDLGTLFIGSRADRTGGSGYFNGFLDEIQLWDSVLTPAQIATAMSGPLTGAEGGLVSYWSFEEGPGSTIAPDRVGAGRDANWTEGANDYVSYMGWQSPTTILPMEVDLNADTVITLFGYDPDNDPSVFSITVMPASGALYQYDDAAPNNVGPQILGPGNVTDPNGRVIFRGPLGPVGGSAIFTFQLTDRWGASSVAPGTVSMTFVDRQVQASPTSRDFGLRIIGETPATQVFQIDNLLGQSNANFRPSASSGVRLEGVDAANFSINSDTGTDPLLPGGANNRSVTVEFDPLTYGAKMAELVIETDDPSTPVLRLPLTGFGNHRPRANSAAGSALDFGENDSYVRITGSGASAIYDITDTLTVECWFRWPAGADPGDWDAMVAKNGEAAGWQLRQHGSNRTLDWTTRGLGLANGDMEGLLSGRTLDDGLWHHAAGVVNGLTKELYVDGILEATETDVAPAVLTTTTDDISFGRRIMGGAPQAGNSLNSDVDEVRIWNIARTPAEILSTMNNPLTGTEPGLVGYWNLDEGGGNVVGSAIVGGDDGVRVNNPPWIPSYAIIWEPSRALTAQYDRATVLRLWADDEDGDATTITITTLPSAAIGVLHHYDAATTGNVGAVVTLPGNAVIDDPLKRVVFVPSGLEGQTTSFEFSVMDALGTPAATPFDVGRADVTLVNISLSPSVADLDFGLFAIGEGPATLDVVLTNSGGGTLVFDNPASIIADNDAGDYSISADTGELTITGAQTRTITVAIDARVKGVTTATLMIFSNDPANPDLAIPLTGLADTRPNAGRSIGSVFTSGDRGGAAGSFLQTEPTGTGPDLSDGDGNANFSWTVWHRRVGVRTATYDYIFSLGSNAAGAQLLHVGYRNTDNIFFFNTWANDIWANNAPVIAATTDGQWHHWAGVQFHDPGDPAVGYRNIYLDGVEVWNKTNPEEPFIGTGSLWLGRRHDGNVDAWGEGLTAQLMLFNNVALTPAQIAALHAAPGTGTEPGLIAYYPLNDGLTDPSVMTARNVLGSGLNLALRESDGGPLPQWVNEGPWGYNPAATVSTDEDAPPTMLLFNGYDADGDPTTGAITVLPGSGSLYQYDAGQPGNIGAEITVVGTALTDANFRAMYVPGNLAGNYVDTAACRFDDGLLVSSQAMTFTINVTGDDDPLVLDPSFTIAIRGTSTTLTAGSLSASGDGPVLMTVTAPPTEGALLVNGATATVGTTVTQPMIDAGLVVYEHDGGATATSDTVAFDIADNVDTGSGVLNILIVESNASPTLAASAVLNVQRLATEPITPAHLTIADDYSPETMLRVTVVTAPAGGVLLKSGAPAPVGGTFTMADITAGRIAYQQTSLTDTTDSFTYDVDDGIGGVLPGQTFNIQVSELSGANRIWNIIE